MQIPPRDVLALGCREAVVLNVLDRHERAGFPPFLNLAMAVSETEATSAVVITGREISPRAVIQDVVDQKAVVDAVRILIHQHPEVTGRGLHHIRGLVVPTTSGKICAQFKLN